MNEEYEYSFKTKSIKPFIDYCKNNKYKLIEESKQIRVLYKNESKVMARITRSFYKNKVIEVLNFKSDKISDNVLQISNESKDLTINDENREFVSSLLEILDYKEIKKLERYRFIFKLNNIIFEIDEYQTPKMNVVAIEGKKEEVDKLYNELKELIEENIINEEE